MAKTYEELKSWIKSLDVQAIFDISKYQEITGTQRSIAYGVAKRLQQGGVPSFKQLKALEAIYRQLRTEKPAQAGRNVKELSAYARQESQDIDTKHLCVRMAWHDAKWNGKICSDPKSNDYCVGEFSLLSERIRRRRNFQGKPQYFDITNEQLAAKAREIGQPNFPSMSWALRYTLDFEGTGIRIPYHEYLAKLEGDNSLPESLLGEIAVTIDEPELREGFTYVAKHIDDDQAIYLLMKIRRSLLKVIDHGFIDSRDANAQLDRVEDLIKFSKADSTIASHIGGFAQFSTFSGHRRYRSSEVTTRSRSRS